ncbi:hypothetical protein [Acidocella aquatica]|uniref:hypothetical protein n=1 Tax=Acidocella aquatica TaxID=1922313 RepID=UPI0024E0C6C3|nr:hypothetical protein [Acidocella aquatica]
MSRFFMFAVASALVGCTVVSPSQPNIASQSTQPDTATITRTLQDNWNQCLNQSYPIEAAQTPDKNEAAEMAFQACQSEQDDLTSIPYSNLIFPHLKAETKQVLIQDGQVPLP